MAVYTGRNRHDKAVRSALKINFAVQEIVNPAIADLYPNSNYSVKHTVGIETSELLVARTGIRGANDLVRVGRAANYAAKLSDQPGPATQITAEVYDRLSQSCIMGSNGQNMWSRRRPPK